MTTEPPVGSVVQAGRFRGFVVARTKMRGMAHCPTCTCPPLPALLAMVPVEVMVPHFETYGDHGAHGGPIMFFDVAELEFA